MIETTETPEDVEKLLVEARAKLQAFEDGVDRKRLLERLRTQSPMHPVLLFRGLFLLLAMLCILAGLGVMMVPVVSPDLARTVAKFEAVVPAPPGIPGLPALLGVLMLCMLVAWLMTTLAAYAIGRDAPMLPWEQKQHQKLVNEVTRLTTQKAVMERIRGTPAGARPRIATPVPVSLRDRAGIATPPGIGRGSALGSRTGGFGAPPSSSGGFGAAPSGGGFGPPPGSGGGFGPPPGSGGGFGPPPGSSANGASGGAFGSGSFGSDPTPAPAPSFGGRFGPPPGDSEGGASLGGGDAVSAPAGGGGVLARARSGNSPAKGGLGGPPPAARGGLGQPAPSPSASPAGSALSGARSGGLSVRPRSTQADPAPAGSALGAKPRAPRLAAPIGFPGTPDPAERSSGPSSGGLFGTPPPSDSMSYRRPESRGAEPDDGEVLLRALDAAADDQLDITSPYSRGGAEIADLSANRLNTQAFPNWGPIDEPWLEEAIQRAEAVAAGFPEQAYLEFSQETHLPFTLVIARATPAMAVRAMVAYVGFLASILTPPRGRIELKNVPHLDSSFHRNVSAALEPYFGDRFDVEPEIGRVEIVFKDPDLSWQDFPVLPTR